MGPGESIQGAVALSITRTRMMPGRNAGLPATMTGKLRQLAATILANTPCITW